MERKLDRNSADGIRDASRVTIIYADKGGYEVRLNLEQFMFKYIAAALKEGLFVKRKVEQRTNKLFAR